MFIKRVSSIRKSTNNEKITFVRHVSSHVMMMMMSGSENCAIKLMEMWYIHETAQQPIFIYSFISNVNSF